MRSSVNHYKLDMDTDKVKKLLNSQIEYFWEWRNTNDSLQTGK